MTDVFHIITPGDHFSPLTGSAVPTVVHGLASGARDSPFRNHVVVQAATYRPHYASAQVIEYSTATAPTSIGRYVDGARGMLGFARRGAQRYFAPAVEALEDREPGIVVAHNAPAVGRLIARSPHRAVLYAHNDILRSYSQYEASRALDAFDRIVAVSESLAEQLAPHLSPSLRGRVHVIGNGVDTEMFTPGAPVEDRVRVMFLGRAIPEKGADILLHAARMIDRDDVEFVIVGSHEFNSRTVLSPFEQRLRSLAEDVPGGIRFEPFVERRALPDLLRTAQILVIPSRWPDPCPLTVGEGLATGLAIVAADRGGIPDALGDAGILFDPDRPEQLAAALDDLIIDPARRHDLAQRARRRAVARDWAWSWAQFERVLDEM
ncbi:glycosyltransferase family 4 protein [Microbacterium profundi]|uniref:glycosyltransferase family 4 protein n=1 Tax=Microbacterium profundi TaxID=450380 RepID=UPI001F1AE5DB|nr:glycosyltransferase family 4 protein [Microbacterium profundi]MCE7481989.1 glycosyltransferase family 4 protein [Microbacterium profundi]